MKYPIQIRSLQGSKRLVVPVVSMQPRCFGNFEAVLDTGSPRTILGAIDAEKLKIPFTSLRTTSPIVGFGKGSTPSLQIDSFDLSIRSEENKLKHLKMPIVIPDIPSIRKMSQSILDHARTIPTLIGMDFLEINNLKLFVNVNQNSAYFEDQ